MQRSLAQLSSASLAVSSSKAIERTAKISGIIALLHKWGIHSLGDFVSLDRQELGARLGAEAMRLWDQASGNSMRLLRLVRPAEVFREEVEFEYEIETAEPLLFVLRRFLEQLTLRLDVFYLLAKELTFHLTFANKSRYQHRFEIPDPTNSVEVLFRLLQTHLENFRTEHPIIAVALEAQPAKASRQQFNFFETPLRDPGRLHETLNRLTGLLGKERVGRPVLEDSHRPESFHLEPFSWELPDSPNEPVRATGPVLRRVRGQSPPQVKGKIIFRQGPYLTSGNWWDEKTWSCTEWDFELENGALCRCQETNEGSQVEGIYD